jgi:hypothetical protein
VLNLVTTIQNTPSRRAHPDQQPSTPSDPKEMRGAALILPIRLLSHNIRYATTSPFKGEELWTVRAPRILNELRYNTLYTPESFICLQEVLNNQIVDIDNGLNANDKWSYIGVGRDDGKRAGEYSPIFYRPDVWKLLSNETKWLSETPDVPSKGWVGEVRSILQERC